MSGVYRISPYLEKFCNNGGIIRCVVGIDQQNTTYDALGQLLKLANEVYIFYSESVSLWMSEFVACDVRAIHFKIKV